MQSREKQDPNALSSQEEALRQKLLTDSDQTNLDRSVSRDGDFGGGFGEGHYTGTSWDPEANGAADVQSRAVSVESEQRIRQRTPTVHDEDYGSAGAGRFGGVQTGPGLTTGAASPTTPR